MEERAEGAYDSLITLSNINVLFCLFIRVDDEHFVGEILSNI